MKIKVKSQVRGPDGRPGTMDVTFDSDKNPIMLVLSEEEKASIAKMTKQYTKICFHPEGFTQKEASLFMESKNVIDLDEGSDDNRSWEIDTQARYIGYASFD
jgi:hypothetical protein